MSPSVSLPPDAESRLRMLENAVGQPKETELQEKKAEADRK